MIPFAVLSGLRLPIICAAVVMLGVGAGMVMDRIAASAVNAREIEHLAQIINRNTEVRAASEQAAETARAAERRARATVTRERERYDAFRQALESRQAEGAGRRCPLDCVVDWEWEAAS